MQDLTGIIEVVHGEGLLGGILTSSMTVKEGEISATEGGFHAKSHLEWDDVSRKQ